MIRSQRFKYCVYDSDKTQEYLVDMEKDPGEMKNLVNDPQFREVLSEHRKLLRDWIRISDDKDGLKYTRNS